MIRLSHSLLAAFLLCGLTLSAQSRKAARSVNKQNKYTEAEACMRDYRFDEAIGLLEEHLKSIKRKKEDTQATDELIQRARRMSAMMRGVERINVIDSVVVDKQQFLSAYHASKQIGTISQSASGTGTTFTNELQDKRIMALPTDTSTVGLFSSIKLIDKWSTPELMKIPGFTTSNVNYPFVHSDGITMWFASDSPEGMGGYDIYVTRQDATDGSFLKPDNLGFPFNSPYNDYLYVIDDFNNLGWFASDRFQPEGKVCIYTFIPNSQKTVYDFDFTPSEHLIQMAQLRSIRLSQTDKEAISAARQRLTQMQQTSADGKPNKADFTIVINDNTVYHHLDDFRSEQARKLYQDYERKIADLHNLEADVEKLRVLYTQADQTERLNQIPQIQDLEKRIKSLYLEVKQLKRLVVNTENTQLNH